MVECVCGWIVARPIRWGSRLEVEAVKNLQSAGSCWVNIRISPKASRHQVKELWKRCGRDSCDVQRNINVLGTVIHLNVNVGLSWYRYSHSLNFTVLKGLEHLESPPRFLTWTGCLEALTDYNQMMRSLSMQPSPFHYAISPSAFGCLKASCFSGFPCRGASSVITRRELHE
jgi:hypothetical protein